MLVREIVGRVRRPGGAWVTVRLWTSLLDASACPAAELLALYARRWDIEVFTKELKVDLRGGTTISQSPTLVTAAQEILALVLAMAMLSQVRLAAATRGAVASLRISFGQTLALVRSLWWLVAVGEGILAPDQLRALVARTLEQIAASSSRCMRRSNKFGRQGVYALLLPRGVVGHGRELFRKQVDGLMLNIRLERTVLQKLRCRLT